MSQAHRAPIEAVLRGVPLDADDGRIQLFDC
jgi:hypothetical protein